MHPAYHYAPRHNWLSDPNGLVHHAGEWHLFYQYNPQGEDWGHMSWGHAVSHDLAAWEELPPALLDDDQYMIFSGSAVIDTHDTAGFGRDTMVAIYTGHAVSGEPRQVQCLAASRDAGRHFTKFASNPVIDRKLADFRDPNVFWHIESGRWIMVVALSTENRAMIYGSHDLKHWDELSEIPTDGAPGHLWECPLLIELPVEQGGTRWLFKVDVLNDAPGSGALYRTGTFDGTRFAPEGDWAVADQGSEFYAAIAWHEPRDEQGRPLWIGWMGNHAYQNRLPRQGWRGAMSLPRRMWLRREDGDRYRLCQMPDPAATSAVAAADDHGTEIAMASHLHLTGSAFRLTLADAEGRSLQVEAGHGKLTVTRHDPVSPFLDTTRQTALTENTALDLWLDVGSVEILSRDGALSLTMQHRLAGDSVSRRMEMTGQG